jgi:hypothetical protein
MQGYAKEITDNKELNVTSVKNRFQFVGISEWTRTQANKHKERRVYLTSLSIPSGTWG